MRIDYVFIKDFKNLKEFEIDLDESFMETILLGQNATGKSNFIESLVLIFKFLDLEKPCVFDYKIKYKCRKFNIIIEFSEGKYDFNVNEKKITATEFNRRKNELLPKYVFTYYSGMSNRLKEHFDQHQRRFYDKIIKPDFNKSEIDGLRRLFYVQLVHSYFVLLAYFAFDKEEEEKSTTFLNEVFGIEDLESILFVLHKPIWAPGEGDERFWGADGLVQEFLAKVWDLSIAPIYHVENIPINFKQSPKQHRLYLYISSKQKLKELSKIYDNSNTEFFKALESTYISDLIEEVRVKIKKEHVGGEIKFKELSEGEQQLLTVIGLLKFTKDEESLILLDEPDTHLNPLWKWRYLEYLKSVVDTEKDSTQIIINTHDPLVIGSLVKEQVRVFNSNKGKITALQPDIDPKGLGVAGILTSSLFGLPTIIDKESFDSLDEKRELELQLFKYGKLNHEQQKRLQELEKELANISLDHSQRDPLYNKFVRAIYENPDLKKPPLDLVERNEQNEKMALIIKQLMDEEKAK